MHNFFTVERLMFERSNDSVSNDIVDKRRAHGRGIAKIIDLNWRGPVAKNFGSRCQRVALQIKRYIDLKSLQLPGNLQGAFLSDIVECVECRNHPLSCVALVVRPK